MTFADISRLRLAHQQITGTAFTAIRDLVAHMGALQAQDYAMVKWAIGARLPGVTDALVEQAFDEGTIVRTHLLRPTWHVVAATDLRWMLALTAPHVMAIAASEWRRLGLDTATLHRANAVVAKALAGGRHLTRRELMTELDRAGIATDSYRSIHLMFHAELTGLVCNGPLRDKQFTYALLDEKVPPGPVFSREEALAELAKRYFTSHGPAMVTDFAWWSGLTLTAARAAAEAAQTDLTVEKIGAQTYYSPKNAATAAPAPAFLLPAFDEFMVSYKDRSAALDPAFAKDAITGNGIFKPIIVVDGRVVGIWKRTVKKDAVLIETQFFAGSGQPDEIALAASMERFGAFLGMRAYPSYGFKP